MNYNKILIDWLSKADTTTLLGTTHDAVWLSWSDGQLPRQQASSAELH